MKKILFILIIILALALASCSLPKPAATAVSTVASAETSAPVAAKEPAATEAVPAPTAEPSASGLPSAEIANDEGGPVRLVGSLDYADFAIPVMLQDAAPALIDMVHVVQGDPTQFAPFESQILGYLTAPVVPPPLKYAFELPTSPIGTLLDVDNNGQKDTGVQIFSLIMGANINAGSHIEQLDQAGDLHSYLRDPITGKIQEGSVLVFAPDDAQGFPSGFGADGILFTEDDPAVGLPQGYTVVHFGPDSFTFDRAAEAEMNVLERAEAASPDFSEQGIVESFNSLIDHLAERYSFTEMRELDWEAIRAEYLPQVEEAEQIFSQDKTTGSAVYVTVLHKLAQSVHDAHVMAVINDPAWAAGVGVANALQNQPIALNVGANTVELADGRVIVTDMAAGSPAAEAGWTLGTEIVAVDGVPVAERLPTIIYNQHTGTDEGRRLFQVNNLLKFPTGEANGPAAPVTIDAILPGAAAAEAFTMTPAAYTLPDRLASATHPMPIQYQVNPTWGYLTWNGFEKPEVNMAVLRQFLTDVKENPGVNGVILDLRGNGGGWDLLYLTMASYFFDPENPVSMYWVDQWVYDPAAGDLVRAAGDKYLISAPQEDLYYGGPVVVLVDQNCASSCEFFSQFMQTNGRATIVGQHASAGAGASINRVKMPGGIIFQYTKNRSYFAGTDEMNLEAKGVVPDERVSVTVESEAAIQKGGDPVLDEALRILYEKYGQSLLDSIRLAPLPADASRGFEGLYPEGWVSNTNSTMLSFTGPLGQYMVSYDGPVDKDLATILTLLGVGDPTTAFQETRSANGLEWSIYGYTDATGFGRRVALTEINGQYYLISLASPVQYADILKTGLLYQLIDAYVR